MTSETEKSAPDRKASDAQLRAARALYQGSRFGEAIPLLRAVLNENPQDFGVLSALGVSYFRTGQFVLAQHFMGEAVRIDPSFVDGLRIRGLALMQLKRHRTALSCFEQAIALKPDFIEVLVNYGTALLDMRRPDDAVAAFDRALKLDPRNAIGWNNRGNALVALRRFENAAASYARALALDPALPGAERNRFLALLELKTVTRIPDFAVKEAFDPIASRFEQIALEELGYRSHMHLRALAERVLPDPKALGRVLDLGCGTGLVGEAFRERLRNGGIDGIDVSPRMLEEAKKRSIYNELIVGDFETALAATGPAYDLILSGDALVYLGDLAPTFVGVAKRLVPEGVFLFTCEAKPGEGWELTSANRFRHSESYLRSEAGRARLAWLEHETCILRQERSVDVVGFAVALKNAS